MKAKPNSRVKKQLLKRVHIYNKIIIVLFITMIILLVFIVPREYKLLKLNMEAKRVINTFASLKDNVDGPSIDYDEIPLKIDKYNVIGVIKIPRIGLEYPVLDRTDVKSLWLGITKLQGAKLHAYGNVTLAGHNAKNGTLFGRLSLVKLNDIIEITDIDKNTIEYQVYDIFSVLPTNTEATKTTDINSREITLITCTMGGKKRLVVKAKEITGTDN